MILVHAVPSGVVDYYLVCNETCITSPFQESYDNATVIFTDLDVAIMSVRDYIENNSPTVVVSY